MSIENVAWKTVSWAIFGVIITVLVLVFAWTAAGYKDRLTAVPDKLEVELLSLRFVNNPDCFTYQDSVRAYPGIIDSSKFTEVQLNRCYTTDETTGQNDFNFRLKLGEKEIQTNNYFNIDHIQMDKTVLVKDDQGFTKQTLQIFVQTRGRR